MTTGLTNAPCWTGHEIALAGLAATVQDSCQVMASPVQASMRHASRLGSVHDAQSAMQDNAAPLPMEFHGLRVGNAAACELLAMRQGGPVVQLAISQLSLVCKPHLGHPCDAHDLL